MALPEKQRKIVEFIGDFIRKNAYPPSVREILEGSGISSTSVVAYNLRLLEDKEYIARDKGLSRGIRLLKDLDGQPASLPLFGTIRIPLAGRIAAG